MKLHDSHERRLGATIKFLEGSLDRMERLLQERERHGIVKVVINTIPAAERKDVFDRIKQFRQDLLDVASAFEVERRSVDIRQILTAELSSAWVTLENCRPVRMKGFGVEFAPEARKLLEEKIQSLLARVTALRAQLE